jgi:hypothetical protein
MKLRSLAPLALLLVANNALALPDPGSVRTLQTCDLSQTWTRTTLYNNVLGTDGVAAQDFDGDGDLDVVSNNEAAGNVTYCQNDGGGTSWTCAQVGTLTAMEGSAIGDFDQDGNLDICITQQTPGAVSIVYGPSSGRTTPGNWTTMTIAAAAGLGKGWMDCAAGDVTGDGHTDIVIGGDTGGSTGTLSYIAGPAADKRTGANWSTLTNIETSGRIMNVFLLDIDGVNGLDILAQTRTTPNVGVFWQQNNGSGSFTRRAISTSIANHGNSHVFMLFEPGDLDEDGDTDICAGTDQQVMRCMLNDDSTNDGVGDWLSWSPIAIPYPTAFGEYTSSSIGDMDDDGYGDVVVGSYNAAANTESAVVIMRRVPGSSPTFSRIEAGGITAFLQKVDNLLLRDFNGDGYLDILYGDQGDEDGVQEGTEGVHILWNPC